MFCMSYVSLYPWETNVQAVGCLEPHPYPLVLINLQNLNMWFGRNEGHLSERSQEVYKVLQSPSLVLSLMGAPGSWGTYRFLYSAVC